MQFLNGTSRQGARKAGTREIHRSSHQCRPSGMTVATCLPPLQQLWTSSEILSESVPFTRFKSLNDPRVLRPPRFHPLSFGPRTWYLYMASLTQKTTSRP
ncbi:hypothetical protein EAO72_26740 [Streptomyces sp. or43]|nr:hypothetical protein EAO72_26740 [Streptomyces sp. or43]